MGTNKCLSEQEIQHFLDNELTRQEQLQILQHIKNCTFCAGKINTQRDWAYQVKLSLRNDALTNGSYSTLPSIKLTEKYLRIRKLRYYKLVLTKLAAIVILFIGTYWFFNQQKNNYYEPNAQELLLWEQKMTNDDANQIFHDQMISTMEINAAGEMLNIEIF
ncbi:MAG: hypothetical protein LT105_03090 [Lentimicrobium sp.]|jgi:hypothetical protein|nr:hypothetical protein [Lentimicrobium sp.]